MSVFYYYIENFTILSGATGSFLFSAVPGIGASPHYPGGYGDAPGLSGTFNGQQITGFSTFGNPVNAVEDTVAAEPAYQGLPVANPYVGTQGIIATVPGNPHPANGLSFSLADGSAVHFYVRPDGAGGYSVAYETSTGGGGPITFQYNPVVASYGCFVDGTRIATAHGKVAIQFLREGDLVVTPSGLRPVRWVGHSIVHPPRTPDPRTAHPIRIRAHAFADGVPSRDLRVSPGHALLVGDVLINAGELVNGGTIVQEEATRVDYYHVELDTHDILIAEGMPCESYLDDGNRASFLNGADHVALHGRIDRASEATCRPLVKSGPLLVEARARLLARAIDLGWVLAEAPGLRLRVGEEEIAPVAEAGRAAWFLLPAGAAGPVRLRSAAAIVNRIAPELADDRRLGVAIGALRIDAADVALDDAAFGAGWYAPETDGHEGWRWMDGDAALTLPPGARMIEVRLQIMLPTLQRVRMAEVVAA